MKNPMEPQELMKLDRLIKGEPGNLEFQGATVLGEPSCFGQYWEAVGIPQAEEDRADPPCHGCVFRGRCFTAFRTGPVKAARNAGQSLDDMVKSLEVNEDALLYAGAPPRPKSQPETETPAQEIKPPVTKKKARKPTT